MYDTALLLFDQSADYRKLWLHLKPESCGNWVKSVGSGIRGTGTWGVGRDVWKCSGEVRVYRKTVWGRYAVRVFRREKQLCLLGLGCEGLGIDKLRPWTFDLGIFLEIDFNLWARKVPELGILIN
nr:L10-interacting MYB domain-containing protein-like [Tanacetum cinerariifolium]